MKKKLVILTAAIAVCAIYHSRSLASGTLDKLEGASAGKSEHLVFIRDLFAKFPPSNMNHVKSSSLSKSEKEFILINVLGYEAKTGETVVVPYQLISRGLKMTPIESGKIAGDVWVRTQRGAKRDGKPKLTKPELQKIVEVFESKLRQIVDDTELEIFRTE